METVKQMIMKYVAGYNGDWVMGGVIDDYIRETSVHKATTVSRKCRELAQKGALEVSRIQINGKGPSVVRYRVSEAITANQPKLL